MSTSSQLRTKARATLGGNIFQPRWLLALLVCVIYTIANTVASYLMFAVLILAGPFSIGLASYFLNLIRKDKSDDDFVALLDGFKNDVGTNIISGLLVQVYTFLWALLFIIPGIVKSYSYSMTFYIRIDHPEYTASQAIEESRKMMYGHKARLFFLDLSFIGWIIVGTMCCGIGMLWVTPYMEASRAHFYEELKSKQIEVLPN